MKAILFVLALGLFGLVYPAAVWGDTLTIGSEGPSNSFPFTDPSYTGEYQQVYSGSAFSGPVEITGITFFPLGISPITGDFSIVLSTTSAGVNTLSTTYANNIGSNNTQFFSGSVTNVLSFTGTPFLYDPSQGNLLMDVEVITPNPTLGSLVAGCSTETNRVFNLGGSGAPTLGNAAVGCIPNSYGLETEFTFTPVNTPEPSSLLLIGTGFAALIGMALRRNARRRGLFSTQN